VSREGCTLSATDRECLFVTVTPSQFGKVPASESKNRSMTIITIIPTKIV
jgi:hypothetical protein